MPMSANETTSAGGRGERPTSDKTPTTFRSTDQPAPLTSPATKVEAAKPEPAKAEPLKTPLDSRAGDVCGAGSTRARSDRQGYHGGPDCISSGCQGPDRASSGCRGSRRAGGEARVTASLSPDLATSGHFPDRSGTRRADADARAHGIRRAGGETGVTAHLPDLATSGDLPDRSGTCCAGAGADAHGTRRAGGETRAGRRSLRRYAKAGTDRREAGGTAEAAGAGARSA